MSVKYPTLTELPSSKDYIEEFGGLNRNLRISPNEFADMCNLTTDEYPVLSTRKGVDDTKTNGSTCGILVGNDFKATCHIKSVKKKVLTTDDFVDEEKVGKIYYSTKYTYAPVIPSTWCMYVEENGAYKLTGDHSFVPGRKYYLKKGSSYIEVSPKAEGYYVKDGSVQVETTDTTVQNGVEYLWRYKAFVEVYGSQNPGEEGYYPQDTIPDPAKTYGKTEYEVWVLDSGTNPKELAAYELVDGVYKSTEDTTVQQGKTYFKSVFVVRYKLTYYPKSDGLYEEKWSGQLELSCGGNRIGFGADEGILNTAANPRDIIPMGANLIVFPDMKYVNTKSGMKFVPEEATWAFQDSGDIQWKATSVNGATATAPVYSTLMCRTDEDGKQLDFAFEFDATTNPSYLEDMSDEDRSKVQGSINNKYVLDKSTGAAYYWIPSTRMWMTATTYISLADKYARDFGISIFENIHDGDGIRIEGLDVSYADSGVEAIKKVFDITDFNPKGILKAPVKVKKVVGEGAKFQIVLDIKTTFPGAANGANYKGCLTYKNYIPKMDFVIENKNRLWGCRYGLNNEGEFVNEIYASKLGDFKSWESFSGVSTDSYAVSVGTDGPFTGAISYLGRPMFFKENCIHTIYGEYPAQYQMMNTECRGVQEGCGASLTIIDGVLYYKSPGGVSAYTGSMPIEIGENLNEKQNKYINAVGYGFKGKYYLAMNIMGRYLLYQYLYVFDIARGIWCKENTESPIVRMCSRGSDDYLTTLEAYGTTHVTSEGNLFVENGLVEGSRYKDDSGDFTKNVEWYAETGDMGLSSNQKKYISRIDVRMSLDVGSKARIFVQYDSSGKWEQVGVLTNTDLAVVSLPIKIKRCDHFRLRFEGKGQAKIYSLSKTLREGSVK